MSKPAGPHPRRHQRDQRGVTLVEAMVAFLILSLGMVTITRLQSQLRFNAEAARQRSEATRIAQEDVERLRAFTRVSAASGAFSYDSIAAQAASAVTGVTGNTTYALSRQVDVATNPDWKAVTTRVSWTDRASEAQQVELWSVIARVDPSLTGLLAIPSDRGTRFNPVRRNPRIPITAKDLGDGRSAFKPLPGSTMAWVFNNVTGLITSTCSVAAATTNAALTLASLTSCSDAQGVLLSGFVRFSTLSSTLTAADAQNPQSWALDLNMALSLTGTPTPSSDCVDDSPAAPSAGQLTVTYFCAIFPTAAPARWSGRLDIAPVGWTIAANGGSNLKVCRYSVDGNGNSTIDNPEHPASYTDVDRSLSNQNFLVIRADATCPTDSAVNLVGDGTDNAADDTTVLHQPAS